MLLDEVKLRATAGRPSTTARVPARAAVAVRHYSNQNRTHVFRRLHNRAARSGWQWPQANEPSFRLDSANGGQLVLAPVGDHASDPVGAVLARSSTSGDYEAMTVIDTRSLKLGAFAGLSALAIPRMRLGWRSARQGRRVAAREEPTQDRRELGGVIWPSVYCA